MSARRCWSIAYPGRNPGPTECGSNVLYPGRGRLRAVRKLIDTAKRDPRDVMNQEYFWRPDIATRTPGRATRGNRNRPEAPELDPAVIAVASVALPCRSGAEFKASWAELCTELHRDHAL